MPNDSSFFFNVPTISATMWC